MKTKLLLLFILVSATLTAEAQTNLTNTVVRFRISYGSRLVGNVDVELFPDKPITVTNFLKYVQSGAYNNSILHHLTHRYVLAGGSGRVTNPRSESVFDDLDLVPRLAPITNEFQSGTLRSNVLGTLSMLKDTPDPDSATSAWFFNLGDNISGVGTNNLDTLDGGYTVFGQVKSGLDYLNEFNFFTLNAGIINMQDISYRAACPQSIQLPSLPVRMAGTGIPGCVRYTNLFAVQVTMLTGPDVLAPKGVVTFPKPKQSLTNENFAVFGTASDNTGIASVKVFLNTNTVVVATGPTNFSTWQASLTNVPPGTNMLEMEFTDHAGNVSTIKQTFFRSVRVPIELSVQGAGTISGAVNNQELELTRFYKLTAKPGAGHLFEAWTGSLVTNTPSITFEMKSNTSLTAVFATNLFPYIDGVYNGLFYNPDDVQQQSSGFVTLKLGSMGTYTAKLLLNGKTHPFKGTFSPDGTETNFIKRPGTNSLRIEMAVDLTNNTDVITGSITNNQEGVFVNTNRSWSATLGMDRAVFDGKTLIATQAGKYTIVLPEATNPTAAQTGDGFGTVSVSAKGAVSLAGTLADGTKASQKSGISKHGFWPLYVPLYKDKGSLISWVRFTNDLTTDVQGDFTWFKQAQPTAKYYPRGFTNEATLIGSTYVAPTTGRAIDLEAATVAFTGGNLAEDFANSVTIDDKNKVTNVSSNKLTLTISKASGLFTGSVTPPNQTKAIPFKGVLLQKQTNGSGFFLGTNQSGRVFLGE